MYIFVYYLTKNKIQMLTKFLDRLEEKPHLIEPMLYGGSLLLGIIITIIDLTYFN